MRYPNTAMGRVTWKSRDDDEKVAYKSRVKRKVFHFLPLPGFLIKNSFNGECHNFYSINKNNNIGHLFKPTHTLNIFTLLSVC